MNSLLTDSRASQLHLPDIVGQGYGTFWRFKGRYRVCKGSRASKKSKTTALWYIVNLMKYPQANLLVIRKVYRTLHDSCFTDLKWAISRLGVQAFWDVKESPLELTYKPTGQKILFRGLDDPLKVTSIAAEHGYLCWAWIEEAYEISSEADFNMIDESIRGAIPPETGLFKQVTLTFNPWNEHHWLKARFFDTPDPDTLALTTNYTCNEWLDDADRRVFERMKVQNPRRYSVAGLGEWGIVDGLVFENWVEEVFEKTIIAARPDVKSAFGLDFGYTNDPTAFFCGQAKEATAEQKEAPAEAPKAAEKKAPAANAKKQTNAKPVTGRTVRVDIEKLDALMNQVSELIIAKNSLVSISSNESGEYQNQSFHEQIEYLERITTNLHESVMKVRMVPIESVVNKFPRMIRDLSRKLGKKMELYMTGEDTELDRTVVDQIGDPLQHLLRNSADHGLEDNATRVERGKPEVGSIFLKAFQEGNNVIIEVGDDGNGIDVAAVRDKAVERGVITAEQAENMSQKEIINILFLPSFSMAKKITDISGRGVGLDVVKSNIEALGGDVEVRTQLGEGTTFIVRLPLTLAIIQALMVEIRDEKYAIALGSISNIESIPVNEIKYVQAQEVIHLRGAVIPLIRLDQVLDMEEKQEEPENLTVVIVKKGDSLAGLVVDNLIGQQEIVIKSLGKYINNNKIISGATILGDGEVALILDVNTLM